MLTILGRLLDQQGRFCDGISRRAFLQIGGLALGGLTMPQLLAAESQSSSRRTAAHKAIIMIYLPGGPPHQDMWDLKPEAPTEVRGHFRPIRTNVRGIEICELFPRMARMMDKFIPIRSIVGSIGHHSAFQCLTGRHPGNQPAGGWPYIGSVLSSLEGPVHPAIPPAIGLAPQSGHRPYRSGRQSGFLGPAHAPFMSSDDRIKADMVLNGVTLERLGDRKALLGSIDRFRRDIDHSGLMDGLDASHRQAFGILTSSKLASAFDLDAEDPKLRDRYGRGSTTPVADAAPRNLDAFLLARRLVEAGARCVTLAFGSWDHHGGLYNKARQQMPMLDQGVTALVQDLHDRGLDQDVSVVVWGEFGRTPRLNKGEGRDHWPQLSCALLAGGGMSTGQVIGASDRHAAEVKDRPVHFQEVLATLYQNMGINVQTATVPDLSGRPRHLIEGQYKPIQEVV